MAKNSRLNPKPVRSPAPAIQQPKSEGAATTAEFTALQSALDTATAECERITKELESRQEIHELAIRAKLDEIAAAEDVIKRLERELSEAKASGTKTGDDTYEHLIGEREKVEEECKRLQTELNQIRTELETTQAQKRDLENELRELRKSHNEAHAELTRLAQAPSADTNSELQEAHREHTRYRALLDKAREKIEQSTALTNELWDQIKELNRQIEQLEADKRALKDSATAPTTTVQIENLNQRCTELSKSLEYQVSLKKAAEEQAADLQKLLQEANQTAAGWETLVSTREGELREAVQKYEQALVLLEKVDAVLNEADPDSSETGDTREDRIRTLAAQLAASAHQPLTAKRAFKMPVVLAAFALAMVAALVAGVIGTHAYMTRATKNSAQSTLGAAVATSASAEAPEVALANTPAGEASDEEEPATEEAAGTSPPTALPETCYPVDANVVALFFGQELRDGKINGQVPVLEAGMKRIKCATPPSYDEASKQTDIFGCEACVPGGPGIYKAENYMKNLSAQVDPSCYTEPYDYKFHMWPSGQSIRFSCDKLAPYDPVRNCRDIRGCNVIVPDPNTVKCATCGR